MNKLWQWYYHESFKGQIKTQVALQEMSWAEQFKYDLSFLYRINGEDKLLLNQK